MHRIIVVGLILAAGCWSCASGGGAQSAAGNASGASAAPASPDPLADFTGVWKGKQVSTMMAARWNVTFKLKRQGNEFKGDYLCAPGNATCRNNTPHGWVRGQIADRGFRVSMEDTSWCTYYMDDFYPPKADGEYTCYMNGGIADQGTFKLIGPPTPTE